MLSCQKKEKEKKDFLFLKKTMHLNTMGGRKESEVYLRKRSVRLIELCQIKDGFTLPLSRNIGF